MLWSQRNETGDCDRTVATFLFVFALGAGFGCSRKQPAQPPPTAPVTVAAAIKTNMPLQLEEIGHVTAFSTVTVQSRVDGMLETVHFNEGDPVQAGQLILTIDPRPFQAALNQAKGNLGKDKALLRNAEVEQQRNAELLKSKIVSKEVYDQSVAAADSLRATLLADQAAVENAELQLSYCYIRAPINGRAGTLLVNAGNVVKSQTTALVTINQTKPINVDFSVPEQELPRIREFMAPTGKLKVEVPIPGREQPPPTGELTIINNTVDPATGTILLRSVFPNDNEALWPGQFVRTILTLTTLSNVVAVPSQAVQNGQQGQYVFVVTSNSTAQNRPVQTGNRVGEEIVVAKGLAAGEEVVTSGQVRLAPGMKVRAEAPRTMPMAAGAGRPSTNGTNRQ